MGVWTYCINEECEAAIQLEDYTLGEIAEGSHDCAACGTANPIQHYTLGEALDKLERRVKDLERKCLKI